MCLFGFHSTSNLLTSIHGINTPNVPYSSTVKLPHTKSEIVCVMQSIKRCSLKSGMKMSVHTDAAPQSFFPPLLSVGWEQDIIVLCVNRLWPTQSLYLIRKGLSNEWIPPQPCSCSLVLKICPAADCWTSATTDSSKTIHWTSLSPEKLAVI